ncbi:MAG: hypothetical protein CM15mP120_29310 [Pseudomonadota bacterium]|nr:MAG: hypothetical protein CM15mP120_29310 [Pseudomonadota bacterium]
METTVGGNGVVYFVSRRPSGELFTWQLQALLQSLFPAVGDIGGEPMDGDTPAKPTYDAPRAYCLLAKQELGLETFDLKPPCVTRWIPTMQWGF